MKDDAYANEDATQELLRISKWPEPLRLAYLLEKEMLYPLHGKAADCLRKMHAELDAIKRDRALDKKAENARELGLDYEPVWNNLPSNKDVEDAMRMKRLNQLAIAAAVPDAFGARDGEHPQYVQGWNDCRAEMLRARKV
jgi:hypothetical protein